VSDAPLRVLPLGGLGEIGKNMTVVEYEGRIVVVDTGLRFPTAEMLGIDLVLPDFTYLRERAENIEAIVITHGHEDHLGALPWVLRELGDGAPDRLRRPADDRDGALQARRAQAPRRELEDVEPGRGAAARPVRRSS
jgi:mRNA degradation ribonuclease J1/J2